MYNVVLIAHVVVVIGLVGLILIQRGRSGGLVEALGGVESIFGTKTNLFFVKATVVLAVLFFSTSIFLAYLSKQKGKSLMERYEDTSVEQTGQDVPKSFNEQPVSQQPVSPDISVPQDADN